MRQFEAFAHQAEDDGMLARIVARPEGMDADFASRTLARHAGPAVDQAVRADRPGGDLRQSDSALGASFLKW